MPRAHPEEFREAKKRIRLLAQDKRVRRGPGPPSGKMSYPLETELAADGVSLAVTSRFLKLSTAPNYTLARRR